MTTEPWLLVTPEELKKGWMEMRGVTPVHHEYLVLGRRDDGAYIVRNPKLALEEAKLGSKKGGA
jgi:hypothetical protein